MRALVAFDLDGVIYSSEPFLGEAYREAIGAVNAQRPGSFARVPSTREILAHVGWPVPVILERLFQGVDAAAVELLSSAALRVICERVARGEGVLFPGVPATLAKLQQADFRLAIASNGRRPYVEAVLAAHHIAPRFIPLATVDRGAGIPDKAGVLRAYLEREALTAAQLLMVGDRASDVEAAAAVGCRFIGCDYGHGHRGELEGAGLIVSSFDKLPAAIAATLENV